MTRTRTIGPLILAAGLALPAPALAQPLGTFRWQLEPHCNVVTIAVTQVGGVYRLEGTDDQCGAGRDQASVVGMAFPNPDRSIGLGLTIVTAPGGVPIHIDAEIALPTLSGTWRDNAGASGSFTFTPGAPTPGYPLSLPSAVVPASISLLPGGAIVARLEGDSGIPATGAGIRMMWYPGKAALRAGHVNGMQWDDVNTGSYSTAFGSNTVASGLSSTAFGGGARATGDTSTAMGFATLADGPMAVALGRNTRASGDTSTAMGSGTTASGAASIAMGAATTAGGAASSALGRRTQALGDDSTAFGADTVAAGTRAASFGTETIASGPNGIAAGRLSRAAGGEAFAFGLQVAADGNGSVALGSHAVAQTGASGAFLFADRSTTDVFVGTQPNEFGVRAAGGVYLYSRGDLATGIALAPNGSSWAALSDANAKENFRDVDGEDLLARLARVPVREWNYKAQDAGIRHIGPTAQDFRAAFGVGDFPLRINTVDADGVALAGVKALEARTRALRDENAELREELATLRARLEALSSPARVP